ncbi:MAG: hypothetical protein ACXWR1_07715 [Bdellovibrionota bacterium]
MKRAVRLAWSVGTPLALTVLFFFFLVLPARAPSGGKLWTGGRTIASLQEEDFDKRLMKLQLCYGVKLVADQCTLERRRVCKAMLVHEAESVFEAPGHFLKTPMEFHCEDTAVGRSILEDDDAVSLRPNAEITAIKTAIGTGLQESAPTATAHAEAREACEFITDCKWAMRPQSFSFRKLASCMTTGNATHRKILLNEVGAMLFGGKSGRRRTLYPNLVEAGGK